MTIIGRHYENPTIEFRVGKPDPYFRWDIPSHRTDLFIGLELDLEAVDVKTKYITKMNHARKAMKDNSDLWVKDDASLFNGFEVCTFPANKDYWRWEHDWSWLKYFKSRGYEVPTTGDSGEGGAMHFHINRDAFIDLEHVSRFEDCVLGLDWLYDTGDLVDHSYCSREKNYYEYENKYRTYEKFCNNKYNAVRVKNNTVEVRCFKAKMDKFSILFAMEVIRECFEQSKYIRK